MTQSFLSFPPAAMVACSREMTFPGKGPPPVVFNLWIARLSPASAARLYQCIASGRDWTVPTPTCGRQMSRRMKRYWHPQHLPRKSILLRTLLLRGPVRQPSLPTSTPPCQTGGARREIRPSTTRLTQSRRHDDLVERRCSAPRVRVVMRQIKQTAYVIMN